ncbi:MAG: NAD-dependent succinate-semialdehyde dehydrogenase [Tepidisphaeraceae bacterium]|jgi:succinate-semialdehyde dehydrogenase/glutarate-semialdehyde dehydrogenase
MLPEFHSVNPATEKVIASYPLHDADDITRRVELAAKGFANWSRTTVEHRSAVLSALAGSLRRRKIELARLMACEMGKPVVAGEGEIEKCAVTCEYFANNACRFLEPQFIPTDATRSHVRFDPLGPILAIMPWNFPFWQAFRAAVPAIAAGNTVILKHAPNVCGCAIAIEEIFAEAGGPDGLLVQVRCENPIAERLVEHPLIRGVTLTGSERAGRAVAAAAGRSLKKCVLELGGSDPFVVLPDADIPAVARAAAAARCTNSGQSCIAAKRFIVDRSVVGPFTNALAGAMRAMTAGDPLDRHTYLGPLARLDLLQNLHCQVENSLAAGARLVCGGQRAARAGYYYDVTVLADVRPGMAAFDEETFGPLAAVIASDNLDDSIELANRSGFGLGASLWSRNSQLAEQAAARLDCGNTFINGAVKSDARLPFGGVKNSGFGRELSAFGLLEFVNVKTVWIRDS